eukprot:gene9756-11561_t
MASESSDDWVVHKYGGTCVGSAERIATGAKLIMETEGTKKVLVVSAMGGTPKVTDLLLDLVSTAAARGDYSDLLSAIEEKHVNAATSLLEEPSRSEFIEVLKSDIVDLAQMLRAISIAGTSTEAFSDFVVGFGEMWCAQMMSRVINQSGTKSTWVNARDFLVVESSDETGQVDVDYELSKKNLEAWLEANPECGIVVLTGFIAVTHDGVPTTLKRNGSDYTATILGGLLSASKITIWTDVDGVYSADPRKVDTAVCLDSMSYHEAWELAYFGANVLHPQCTLPAMQNNVPIVLRNFFNLSAAGTAITSYEESLETLKARDGRTSQLVKGFATIDDMSLINVEGTGMVGVPGTASSVFAAVREANVNVAMISQASSEHSICFAVKSDQAEDAVNALSERFEREISQGLINDIRVIPKQCILAAVGQGMASTPGVSAILFSALAKANINVTAIAQGCSEYNLTVVVDQSNAVKALRAAHARFYLSETPIAIAVIGPGLIGATLLDQMAAQMESLNSAYNIELRVLGVASSRFMHMGSCRPGWDGPSSCGLDLKNWREEYENDKEAFDLDAFEANLLESAIPNMAIIDCTASDQVAGWYERFMSKGIHVITPNKKANSGDIEYFKRLRDIGRKTYTHFFYEATVGAGLPIISTLRSLVNNGDGIHKIEGIFSGTLSYIFNEFDGSAPFSDTVKVAKELGFTEPDPRDDLSGTDVARKVTILAREAGLQLELKDIPVQSLVPEPLQSVESADEYMERLPEFDSDMAKLAEEAAAAGEVLRFVGVVDVKAGTGCVELRRFPNDHPFATLKGSDNIISFTTDRYKSSGPLIVRGPGAGAEVTAGGVFSDLLQLSAYLGAPS